MIFLLYKGTSALIIYICIFPTSIEAQKYCAFTYNSNGRSSIKCPFQDSPSTQQNVSIMSSLAVIVQRQSWSWSGCQTSLARPASLGWWTQPGGEVLSQSPEFSRFFVLLRSSGFSALLVSRMVPRSPPKIHTPLKSPFFFMVLPLTPSSSSLPPRSAKAGHTFCLS